MSRPYEQIAERLLAMKDTTGNWRPCWHGVGLRPPTNPVTGKQYRGVNILSAWTSPFEAQEWATYQQWQSIGAQVRKGEHGTPFVVFKTYEKANDNGEAQRVQFARGFRVFNAAQVDGFESNANASGPTNPDEKIEACETFARNTRATVLHVAGVTPSYWPALDVVKMPPFETFHHAVGYYGTLLHELTHWTRAKHRLDRNWDAPNGERKRYALEELVAELGASFLAADLGIEAEPREDHAQYLAFWHQALKNDPAAFMHAVALASKAAEYLHTLQEEVRAAA